MKQLLILLFLFFSIGFCAKAQKDTGPPQKNATIVYVIRHAEKANSNGDNPGLSEEGKARAESLKTYFADKQLNAVYVSNYKRSKETGEPVAKSKNIKAREYNARNINALAARVIREHVNQAVLIVGHSNTVLETIEAFHVKRPIPQLTDSDYKYLFKVTIPDRGDPFVEVSEY